MAEPLLPPIPRWSIRALAVVAVLLVPWTLYLTFTLPARHVTTHWDIAWVGFDAALLSAVAGTIVTALRHSRWLVPLAAVTGTMLLCDAWFDVVTSQGASEVGEAVLEAVLAEVPLAAVCAFIVIDAARLFRTLERARRR